jgi:hypothetical protein
MITIKLFEKFNKFKKSLMNTWNSKKKYLSKKKFSMVMLNKGIKLKFLYQLKTGDPQITCFLQRNKVITGI